MTGYGRGELIQSNYSFTVELKSVNHRFCEVLVKMPRAYGMLEDKVKKLVQAQTARGRIEVLINIEASGEREIRIDKGLALAYYSALKDLQCELQLEGAISLQMMTQFRDILQLEETGASAESIWPGLQETLGQAIAQFSASRLAEGGRLQVDIAERVQVITDVVQKIAQRAPLVVEMYQMRLKERLTEVLKDGTLDEGRLLMEVALLADKCNIDEELVRLDSHLQQADLLLQATQPIGRQLDFLIQEMNRETNTIGAKANDGIIARLVIQGKSEIEKIREQIQNIE